MNFEFTENTLIIINWIYKNCRLDVGESLRFICSFNTPDGEWQCSVDLQEVNAGETGADGQYCITIDSSEKGILPGRYTFDLLHLLNTGESISLITQNSGLIEILPAAVPVQNLYKTNEIYSDLPYRNQNYNKLINTPTVNGAELRGEITNNEEIFDKKPTAGSSKLLTSGAVAKNIYSKTESDELLKKKSEADHTHSYSDISDKPSINGIALEGNADVNGLMYRRLLTSADDLDEIFEDGVYVYSTSSVPANAPFENAAVVEVFGAKSTSTQKIQRAYRYGVAGYSAFRPLYAGNWLEWQETDTVLEQGESNEWTYRKWRSGLAECWGRVQITIQKVYSYATDMTAVAGYGTAPSSLFTSIECVTATPLYWYEFGIRANATSNVSLNFDVIGLSSNSTFSAIAKGDVIEANCIVKGRWK